MKAFALIVSLVLAGWFFGPAPAAAQSADERNCFSTNSDDYKREDFYARGLAACVREIRSGRHTGKNLAFYLRAQGYWLRVMGRLEEALPIYNRAIELDPQHVEGYDYRAVVFQRLGNNDRAIADWGVAIRLDPTYAAAYYQRGNLYQTLGEFARAKEDYNSALALPAKNRIGEWAHGEARDRLDELAKEGK
ncbi:MAG: tetratricopeptide repeat protein [Rhizobiales bacterium]|nr:tetratricopeptide repeat protein [Hyphomicrobiales bacterium]